MTNFFLALTRTRDYAAPPARSCPMRRGLALALLLASSTARADPEGYQGGEGRPPGTTYAREGSLSLTVRAVTVEAGRSDGKWICGGVAAPRSTEDLVTVTLVIANPSAEPRSDALANFDLVLADKHVVGGSCLRAKQVVAEGTLAPKRRRTVRAQFLVPRGARPTILVYNDDDFPALFALPKAKRP